MWMGHGLSLSHWVRGGDIIWVVWDCGVGQAFEFRFLQQRRLRLRDSSLSFAGQLEPWFRTA